MQFSLRSKLSLAPLSCVLLAGLATGCAQERDPIDRVQPNYLDKAYFLDNDGDDKNDEWYYQRTVVDVPAGNAFTFVGDTDFWGLKRVTWDIQENFLYARRNLELIEGGEQLEDFGNGEPYEGEVVAAFRIESHFDITYAYNPTTGEQLNIVEENMRDRPWYERTFMRVDWSQNLVTNYDFLWERPSIEPIPYYVQDYDSTDGVRNPDAPVFEPNYFDITNKLFAKAGTVNYEPWGDIPLCWFDEMIECGAGEFSIRHSFKKIDPTHEYDPFPYKGKMTEVFGYFWTDRHQWKEEGIYEQNKQRYMQRHNLFNTWFDANGDLLPVAQRELRPVVYHINDKWPTDDATMMKAIDIVEEQYNDVFTESVNEMLKDEGADLLPDDVQMFLVCRNNPVKEGDPAACGPAGTKPRIGDIRYSFIAFVPEYMSYGLLGFGPSNTDPETGEVISGMAYMYEKNDLWAHRTVEMIELLQGARNPDTYIGGLDLTDWINQVNDGEQNTAATQANLADYQGKVQRMTHGWTSQLWEGRRHPPTAADVQEQREQGVERWMQPRLDRVYLEGHLRGTGDNGKGKLAALAGTEIEDMMISDDILMAVGHDPRLGVSDDVMDRASVLRGGFGQFMKDRTNVLEKLAMEKNAYLPAMADEALIGLARQLAQEDKTYEEMLQIIREAIYVGVLAHELGHSFGLMHNFGASDDAINYHDDYWEIRALDGTVKPRIQDPVTDEELNSHLYDYATSSVMDYMRFPQDRFGLGKYDRAAILFGYAKKVEVFDNVGSMDPADLAEWYNSDGDPLWFFSDAPTAKHYTTYYEEMGENLYAAENRILVDIDTIAADWTFEEGRDGRPRVPYIYCSHSRANLGDSCLTRDFGADAGERMDHLIDGLNTWYIMRNFPRGEVGMDNWNYVGRIYRNYDRLKQWHDLYGLYKDFLPSLYPPDELETFFNDPVDGWGVKSYAVNKAFNHLIQTILMPDIQDYVLERQPDGSQMYKLSDFGGGAVITDVTNARYFSTSWFDTSESARECGYMFWECLHHVGYYLDKIMAIEALSDSETNFVGRSTPEDIREWEISYYSTFSDEITKLNAAILGQDWSKVAPYWAQNELQWPNYSSEMDETHALPVDPYATFSIQLYWQVLGRARFPDTYDNSFVEESRVFIQGTALEPDVDEDRLMSYLDPISGLTYCAVTYDGNGAAEMAVKRANAMKARSDFCDNAGDPATETTEDDCISLENGINRVQVTAALLNWNEVLKTMVRIDQTMEWGNPYDP